MTNQELLAAAAAPAPVKRRGKSYVEQIADLARPNPMGLLLAFVDFEYNDQEVVCAHFVVRDESGTDTEVAFWLSQNRDAEEFTAFVTALIELGAVFVGHAVGIAEMIAMLRMGIDLTQSQWIDTFTEAKMIGLNHKFIGFPSLKLLDVATRLGLSPPTTSEHKEEMRELIIGGGPFTAQDEAAILAYCAEDTRVLPDVLSRLHAVHEKSKAPCEPIYYLRRGDYLLATTLLSWRTKGLPVNVAFWRSMMRYQQEIRDTIAKECNEHYRVTYGVEFYTPDLKRTQSRYRLRKKLIAEWAEGQGFEWARTRAGQPQTDRDYLDEMVRRIPALVKLRETKDALTALGSVRLVIDSDGYVNPGYRTFHTVTGRNQPMVKEAFIFNMAPLFRVGGTKPKPGMAMIAADWSKQEPAIAISLSGDNAYLEAFRSQDLYMTCAIKAGAAPEGANEETHPVIRQAFKAAMLGIGYGMGFDTLWKKVHAEVNKGKAKEVMLVEEAQEHAATILSWHKETFHVMWDYLFRRATMGRDYGWVASEDGWFAYVNDHTKQTQLINFPIQANGAAMLREAVISLARETDLDIPFTLHDAIYANCRIEDIERAKAILTDHMDRAARAILSDNPIDIKIGFKVITEDKPLDDKRADKLLPLVQQTIADLEARDHMFTTIGGVQ